MTEHTVAMFPRLLLSVAVAIGLLGCPSDDNDGDGGSDTDVSTVDSGQSEDATVDVATGDAGDLPAELFGTYSMVSISAFGTSITTENSDVGGGILIRGDGTLELNAAGTYTLVLHFYRNDALDETENHEGTWTVSGDVVTITDNNETDPSNYRYEFTAGTGLLNMTRIEPSALEIDSMLFQKQ